MDETYLDRKPKNWGIVLIVAGIAILTVGGVFLWLKSQQKLVSPVPSEPTFEVIFYTPTPGETTPTSTPSATPKVKKAPTITPKPTKEATASPTVKPTVKASPSPTTKPPSPTAKPTT